MMTTLQVRTLWESQGMLNPSLILASGSPYRKLLLENAGYQVTAVVSGVEEPDLSTFADWKAGLIFLAQMKARAVQQQGHRGLILAADTMSCVDHEFLGKPLDRADARRMLQMLSGTEHSVHTGWCLLRTADELSWCGVEHTSITMRSWGEQEVESYLDSGEWQGKCGAYGLQLPTDPFVTSLRGSESNVIGIPLERLASLFAEFPRIAAEVTRPKGMISDLE